MQEKQWKSYFLKKLKTKVNLFEYDLNFNTL